MDKEIIIPKGATCHYERIEGKWFVVWGADFPQDDPGRKLVSSNEAFLLECGYEYANYINRLAQAYSVDMQETDGKNAK